MTETVLALLISLHLITATVVSPPILAPIPVSYTVVAPTHTPASVRASQIPRASRSSVRMPLPIFDVAPHTHAGLKAWVATLPYPWPQIIGCESLRDDSWREDSNSYARGVFQFLRSTWASLGLSGDPAAASWRDQYRAAVRLKARDGIRAWDCARIMGVG
jgi:Transglycosylase-like domain